MVLTLYFSPLLLTVNNAQYNYVSCKYLRAKLNVFLIVSEIYTVVDSFSSYICFFISIIAIFQGVFLLTLFSDCTLGPASNTITWSEQVLGQSQGRFFL